jgi:uncharacterized membrane protein YkoI
MIEKNDALNFDVLSEMSLQELMIIAEGLEIPSESLFSKKVNKSNRKSDDDNKNIEINEEEATLRALEKVGGGEIKKIKVDDGDYEIQIIFNSYKYKISLDGRTGEIKEYKVELMSEDQTLEVTEAQARAIALEQVGGGEVTKLEVDDLKYEIDILFNNVKYELEIHGLTGEILKYEDESMEEDKVLELTKEEASAIALEKVGGGEVINLEVDDSKYEIDILFDNVKYELKIHGRTGEILEYEVESEDDDQALEITKEEASAIALEKVGGGEILDLEVDDSMYEIEVLFNNMKYELKIHGLTGEILKYEVESEDDDQAIEITKEEASAIALKKVGGGEILDLEVDDSKYEIKVLFNNMKYELKIHGLTGEILKYEVESEDDDQAIEITKEEASAIALKKVGGGEVKEVKIDDNYYEIEIKFNGEKYELKIDGRTGEIKEYEVESDD